MDPERIKTLQKKSQKFANIKTIETNIRQRPEYINKAGKRKTKIIKKIERHRRAMKRENCMTDLLYTSKTFYQFLFFSKFQLFC